MDGHSTVIFERLSAGAAEQAMEPIYESFPIFFDTGHNPINREDTGYGFEKDSHAYEISSTLVSTPCHDSKQATTEDRVFTEGSGDLPKRTDSGYDDDFGGYVEQPSCPVDQESMQKEVDAPTHSNKALKSGTLDSFNSTSPARSDPVITQGDHFPVLSLTLSQLASCSELQPKRTLTSKTPSTHTDLGAEAETNHFKSPNTEKSLPTILDNGTQRASLFDAQDSAILSEDTESESSFSSVSSSTDGCPKNFEFLRQKGARQMLVERLERYFQSFSALKRGQSSPQDKSGTNQCQSEPRSSSGIQEISKLPERPSRKRGREGQSGDDQSGDDEDSDGERRKRSKRTEEVAEGTHSQVQHRLLACPYYKRNPRKYRHQKSCPGPGWINVHRLKAEHLKKFHFKRRCLRCGDRFSKEETLAAHFLMDPACKVRRPLDPVDEFHQQQMQELKSRQRGPGAITEEEKWSRVYRILFPDDNPADEPTAYYDDLDDFTEEDVTDYHLFSQQAFLHQFFQGFDRRMSQDDSLRREFEDIINEAWNSIPPFRGWIRTRVSPSGEQTLLTVPVAVAGGPHATSSLFPETAISNTIRRDTETPSIETPSNEAPSNQTQNNIPIITHSPAAIPEPALVPYEDWLNWPPTAGNEFSNQIDQMMKSHLTDQNFTAPSDSGFQSENPNHGAFSP